MRRERDSEEARSSGVPVVNRRLSQAPAQLLDCPNLEVWQADTDLPLDEVNRFGVFLSEDEHRRANGYGDDALRNRFIVRRGLLRSFLGSRLAVEPGNVSFAYSDRGKPGLAHPESLWFSVASSGGRAVFAFSKCGEVGVDVEAVRAFPEEPTATDHFSPAERGLLRAVRGIKRRKLFFALWTRKEACAKALGLGVLDSYVRFEVPWPAGAESRPVDDGLAVTDLRVENRFIGAVARKLG